MLRFYDFFAGAGLATCGLGGAWQCVWANDIDLKKGEVYKANFGPEHFFTGDVSHFTAADIPNSTQLAWASFPCQDLSLAGWQRGLEADKSGAFWAFWKIMRGQLADGGRPPVVVIENVVGLLHDEGFAGLCEALAALGMCFGAVVIDARRFLPQSRPRVFVVAVDDRLDTLEFTSAIPTPDWTPAALLRAHAKLSPELRERWRWWNLAVPDDSVPSLEKIIETVPTGVGWHSERETQYLLSLMNQTNLAKVESARADGGHHIGFVYKRIRDGVQRAEVRFDGIAGCLRTPTGGSSRQTVLVVDRGKVRSRLLSPREAARLMGAPEWFKLPKNYNDAYKAMGDAVAVPVVSWLSAHLLEPLAKRAAKLSKGAHGTNGQLLERAERRASSWVVEANKVAAKDLIGQALAVVEAWHKAWDEKKFTESDSFIACAGIKVAETSRKKWPIERTDLVSEGGRFRSTGPFIQGVLERRFGEERPYTSEGGRTTGTCIPASEDLVARLMKIPGYGTASPEMRAAVADSVERFLYDRVVKPSLDSEGISVHINLSEAPPRIIAEILAAGAKRGLSGTVAQHLVGAKLALRFPALKIDNYSHTTKDQQLGRRGDFILNDTVLHVTMSPGAAVVEKCEKNVDNSFQPILLVPHEQSARANELVARSRHASCIWVKTIEEFVAQNIAEIGEFGKTGLRQGIKSLIDTYNARAEEAGEKRSARISPPQNL